jgi:hypothetical protein
MSIKRVQMPVRLRGQTTGIAGGTRVTCRVGALTRFLVLFTGAAVLAAAGPACADLYPVTQDTFIDARAPDRGHGALRRLNVTFWSPHTAFVRFDLRGLRADQTVSRAVLRLRVNELKSTGEVWLHLVRESWSESRLTAGNRPDMDANSIARLVLKSDDADGLVEVDVTAAVQAWQQGRANQGLALRAGEGTNVKFDARESADGTAAQLEVVTTTASSPAPVH